MQQGEGRPLRITHVYFIIADQVENEWRGLGRRTNCRFLAQAERINYGRATIETTGENGGKRVWVLLGWGWRGRGGREKIAPAPSSAASTHARGAHA